MVPYSVSGSARIAAPPAHIYAIISDYHRGHPAILPKQFSNLRVESGSGIGAGTTIRFEVTMMGAIERFLISRALPPLYAAELRLLEARATSPDPATSNPTA